YALRRSCRFVLLTLLSFFLLFLFYGFGHHRALHSFPTRRSSDLVLPVREQDDRRRRLRRPGHRGLRRLRRGVRVLRLREHGRRRSEEHTSELQSPCNLVCRLLLEKKKSTLVDEPFRPDRPVPPRR